MMTLISFFGQQLYFVNFTMSSLQIERKLAAIMFTDIAGYTAQMSKDEAAKFLSYPMPKTIVEEWEKVK